MRRFRFRSLSPFIFLICLMLPVSVFPQSGEMVQDPEGKFTLQLPNKAWLAVISRDGLNRPQLDIVYRVREDGDLEIRQVIVEPGTKALDFAKKDEQTLSFQAPGYAKGSIESFGASSDAAVLTYDYTRGGRPMMGRRYYLRVSDNTIFVLRFTGNRTTLGPLRSQTDAIARSFRVK